MEKFSVLLRINQLRKVFLFPKGGDSIEFMTANVAVVACKALVERLIISSR